MNTKNAKIVMVFLAAGLLLVALAALNGCKKEPAPAAPPVSSAVALTLPEQTICPIMGKPIDKNVYTEYKGKKVYFCCPACVEKFKAEPEKYIAKLPQFKS
jgi:YHS domain-containing protein